MLSRRIAFILSLGLLACATTTPAPQPAPASTAAAPATLITAEIIAAGAEIIAVGANAPVPGRVAAPGTTEGSVANLGADFVPRFLPGGTSIQARLGTRFGMQVMIKGAAKGTIIPLRTRVTHPPITNPATGKGGTVDVWDSPMNAGILRYTGWGFDNPWELVAGSWKIEILDGERPIAEQQFTITTSPDSSPERQN